MGKTTLVPITPSVLGWALKESGYDPRVVAQKVGVTVDTLQEWLRGVGQPKLTQFKKLVTLLKRTPSTLLLPRPPETTAPPVEFRRPPGTDRAELNPAERRYLREARRLQDLSLWLQRELGEQVDPLHHHRTDTDPEDLAAAVSVNLFPARPEEGFSSASSAFAWWRTALESAGVLVFSFPLGRDAVRGFSIWNDSAPVVAVNTAWRIEARAYTLFHEFGHLLTRTASACLEAARRFARPSDAIERWCEQFSAAVLLPRTDVDRFLSQDLRRPPDLRVEDLDVPSRLANRFKVSLRAATLRLIEMKLAGWDLYSQIPPVADNKPRGGGGRGRQRGEIREAQYGDRTVRLFVSALNRDVLGRTDVLDALDISDADLTRLERRSIRTA